MSKEGSSMTERTRDQWVERKVDVENSRLQNENSMLWSTIGEFRIHIENLKRDVVSCEEDIEDLQTELQKLKVEIANVRGTIQPVEGLMQKQIGKWVLTAAGVIAGIIGMGIANSLSKPVIEMISKPLSGRIVTQPAATQEQYGVRQAEQGYTKYRERGNETSADVVERTRDISR
jgi:DNA repair exonuclease SbcCD ATPase subunit